MCEARREINEQASEEKRYYLSSLSVDALRLAEAVKEINLAFGIRTGELRERWKKCIRELTQMK